MPGKSGLRVSSTTKTLRCFSSGALGTSAPASAAAPLLAPLPLLLALAPPLLLLPLPLLAPAALSPSAAAARARRSPRRLFVVVAWCLGWCVGARGAR